MCKRNLLRIFCRKLFRKNLTAFQKRNKSFKECITVFKYKEIISTETDLIPCLITEVIAWRCSTIYVFLKLSQ